MRCPLQRAHRVAELAIAGNEWVLPNKGHSGTPAPAARIAAREIVRASLSLSLSRSHECRGKRGGAPVFAHTREGAMIAHVPRVFVALAVSRPARTVRVVVGQQRRRRRRRWQRRRRQWRRWQWRRRRQRRQGHGRGGGARGRTRGTCRSAQSYCPSLTSYGYMHGGKAVRTKCHKGGGAGHVHEGLVACLSPHSGGSERG